MTAIERIEQEIDHGIAELCLPEHMILGIKDYVLSGVRPGSFLTAVFENDLAKACAKADSINMEGIYNYGFFLLNYVPAICWGNKDRVDNWCATGGARGMWPEGE
jgi:hypothetical protein